MFFVLLSIVFLAVNAESIKPVSGNSYNKIGESAWNGIVDLYLTNAQTQLMNYTIIHLPSFSYTSVLCCTLKVPSTTVKGLPSFLRSGDVTFDVAPLKTEANIGFGLNWNEIISVFDIEMYWFQPENFALIPKKGTLTITLSNLTSVQNFTFTLITNQEQVQLSYYNLSIQNIDVKINGLGEGPKITGEAITKFLNQNKDLYLTSMSFIIKLIFNALFSGMSDTIKSNI